MLEAQMTLFKIVHCSSLRLEDAQVPSCKARFHLDYWSNANVSLTY